MPNRVSHRWALLLQYDGADFAGSQLQPNLPTLQGALQDALTSLTGEEIAVSLAGRTDAGVHATGQVASFVCGTSPETMPAPRWVRGLNHFLPRSVAVQNAAAVPLDFDPRRRAVSRTYEYSLRVSRQRQPLWERRAWIVQPPFDVDAAREALNSLLGERDFAAFTPPMPERSTVRKLTEASLSSHGPAITIRFRADAFLQHQVRRMVGAIVEIARGRLSPTQFAESLAAAAPGSLGPTAPACGLCLVAVEYARPIFTAQHWLPECEGD